MSELFPFWITAQKEACKPVRWYGWQVLFGRKKIILKKSKSFICTRLLSLDLSQGRTTSSASLSTCIPGQVNPMLTWGLWPTATSTKSSEKMFWRCLTCILSLQTTSGTTWKSPSTSEMWVYKRHPRLRVNMWILVHEDSLNTSEILESLQ